MILELHAHTSEHSPCSRVKAVDLLHFVMEQGIQGVALTDHHYLWSDGELGQLRRLSGIPDEFVLCSGQEVTTSDFGDVLVYGANEPINPWIHLSELRRRYPAAALVWAHPYRGMRRPTSIDLFNSAFDAIEILNQHQSLEGNSDAMRDWNQWGFVATSGTDIHTLDPLALYPTEFSAEIGGLEDLVLAIKSASCRPVFDYHVK